MNPIHEFRRKKKKSQRSFADYSGFSQASICRWETGSRIPSPRAISILAEVMEIAPETLVSRLKGTEENGYSFHDQDDSHE